MIKHYLFEGDDCVREATLAEVRKHPLVDSRGEMLVFGCSIANAKLGIHFSTVSDEKVPKLFLVRVTYPSWREESIPAPTLQGAIVTFMQLVIGLLTGGDQLTRVKIARPE